MFNNDNFIPFNFYYPMYNWFFPFAFEHLEEKLSSKVKNNPLEIFNYIGGEPKYRALYFHIPFCEDICAFCPFPREVLVKEQKLDMYVEAIVNEIALKASYSNIASFPISAIFFGGGTPSILKPKHILQIGEAIHKHFDLSALKEFSFEMNAKTVKKDKVQALQQIGVTHPRMGVQTLNPKYRAMFELSATINQIYSGAELLNNSFPNVCIDMLYAMHGQTIDELLIDLHKAISLDTSNIDVYPINNASIQKRLVDNYKKASLLPTNGLSKLGMNVLSRQYMKANHYLPHNGHGYVKDTSKQGLSSQEVVTDRYTFEYHEAFYGYVGHEIIGFGSAACSSFDGYMLVNSMDINKYISELRNNHVPMQIGQYDKKLCEMKGIALHLPYHGVADKKYIDLESLGTDLTKKLNNVIKLGLVTETEKQFKLTEMGLNWYVDLLYYFSPKTDQDELDNWVSAVSNKEDSGMENWKIELEFER